MEKKTDNTWSLIRIVKDGDGDYSFLSTLYEKDNYEEIANYLKEWDYGESEEADEPKLALYDYTLFVDDNYKLIYNISIGGTFALFRKNV
ncbi:hypothetical protein [Bacteroides sp.]|jgi:hypothetical protein|uniref:hypothetical protein n=1 Tax=Bacteroides sp. TaxID=29523 RepID=UPI00262824CB|nr:hypothetical protein [Bacteroides sp.]MDD3038077.1 hypothetical protein [Bacteroides sp.]